MTVFIAPNPRQQYLDANGDPLSGGLLFTYATGTTTKATTYTTSVGSVANTNPIVLDSSGRSPYGIWLTDGQAYKFTLAPSGDTDPPSASVFVEDNIDGVNDISPTSSSQWTSSGFTPTYISTTQFSVAGDQVSDLMVGRRVQATISSGTVYGVISVSAYTSITTVTLVMDAGDALDSGMSAFNYGVLSATSHSIPKLTPALWNAVGLAPIPATTVMLFFQSAAPVGWTQVAANNDKAIRVVSGTGGGTGGTVAFETAFASQTPAGTNAGTAISTAQMPAHTHTGGINTSIAGVQGGAQTYTATSTSVASGSTGGGGTHTHTFSGTAINIDVAYINVIYCSKD
tara:strand:- start:134 stop:1162 length:1029 start_codon:yes stop_codon:yes gene_type:complete